MSGSGQRGRSWLLLVLVAATVSCGLSSTGTSETLEYRLLFWLGGLHTDAEVEQIRDLASRGSAAGFNGIVVSANLERTPIASQDYLTRLSELRKIGEDYDIRIIPSLFSIGYANALLDNDKNLAAAMPVVDVPHVMRDGEAHFVSTSEATIKNGDFENYDGHHASEFTLHDQPGNVSFMDQHVSKSGRASIRFEKFTALSDRHARVRQMVSVRPFRCYRLSVWVKTENLDPVDHFQLQVRTTDARVLMTYSPPVAATSDWQEVSVAFNSLDNEMVRVYSGVWGAKSGRFWLDDMKIEEVGMNNVLTREGTPVTVRHAETGVEFGSAIDYEPIVDSELTYRFDRPALTITATPRSRIEDGDRLLVSYYQALSLQRGQIGVCMSEEKVYQLWTEALASINEHLRPDVYLLSIDEIRQGGWCAACVRRGLTAASLLGDCVTRQTDLIRKANNDAVILAWSDMLDPNHNAVDRYYLFNGSFAGSWKHVPKDLVVVCWQPRHLKESLQHFDDNGFRTMAAAYYDSGDLVSTGDWITGIKDTPGACGIMYTTWRGDYRLLEPFAELTFQEIDR